jgi:hypothetical protein
VLNTYRRLLRTSRPVLLMTALVAIFGITGTAVAAKRLVTGADIKNGSITRVDLSRSAQAALRGKKGEAGASGTTGAVGVRGETGGAGIGGAQGGPGATGRDGSAGSNGTNGTNGAAGASGSPGGVGSQGATGLSGPQGTAGIQGATGTTGGQGITGTTGPQGVPAVQYFAAISATGVVSRTSGILSASGTGGVFDVVTIATDLSACVATAQAGLDIDQVPGSAAATPIASGHVTVKTWNSANALTSESFVLTISC